MRGEIPAPAWDFAYGARFMDLVELVLREPDRDPAAVRADAGGRAAAAALPTAAAAGACDGDQARRARPPVSERGSEGRPTVLVHHAHGAQRRFFSPDQLQSLTEYADVVTWSDAEGPDLLARADVFVTGRGAPRRPTS